MLRSLFSRAYSELFIVGDGAGWSIDEDAKALKKIADKLGIKSRIVSRTPFNIPQAVHYNSQFALRYENIYKSRHRISVDYYHGKPEQQESFRECFEALKRNHERTTRVRVSTKEMEELIRSSGIDPAKVMRIPIGIDTDLFTPQTSENRKRARKNLGIPQDALVIGSFQKDGAGWGEGMEPKLIKGPDIFLQVIERLNNTFPNMFILLSGPARGYVKHGLEKLGIPYIHERLEDFRELTRLYDALDLYLVTSREEGGPKAVLESMAKGVPLVTTEVGQARDLVKNGENAMIVSIDDVEGLCKASIKALENKEVLTRNGHQCARENNFEAQLPLWSSYFETLIEP